MVKQQEVAVVWFKRDLRVTDHAALAAATATGLPVVPFYCVEPEYWGLPDTAARQYEFIRESLIELREALAALGQPLIVRMGDAVELLKRLHAKHPIAAIFAHEETGNDWTYQRDIKLSAFARSHNIPFQEMPQNGVIRRIKTRDGWAIHWDKRMSEPQIAARQLTPVPGIESGPIPTAKELGLAYDFCPGRQKGGRNAGLSRLGAFLTRDGLPYQRAMSFPAAGALHCSRMSPHLAYGTLSVREIAQSTSARHEELKHPSNSEPPEWRRAMVSFIGRLHWRDHFMQKLEDQTSIEFQPLHPAMRKKQGLLGSADQLEAWQKGETGVPFVDACMRSLNETGWLNFRMRAMLVSFASHLLDVPWRQSGMHMARQFTDYEPGIHWSQMQMQSGLTGINTIRIYNPVKQGLEHDVDGHFIRKWVPELEGAPLDYLHNPFQSEGFLTSKTGNYPAPVIDVTAAMRAARERLHATRKSKAFHEASDQIQAKHGSRKAGLKHTDKMMFAKRKAATDKNSKPKKPDETQTDLFS